MADDSTPENPPEPAGSRAPGDYTFADGDGPDTSAPAARPRQPQREKSWVFRTKTRTVATFVAAGAAVIAVVLAATGAFSGGKKSSGIDQTAGAGSSVSVPPPVPATPSASATSSITSSTPSVTPSGSLSSTPIATYGAPTPSSAPAGKYTVNYSSGPDGTAPQPLTVFLGQSNTVGADISMKVDVGTQAPKRVTDITITETPFAIDLSTQKHVKPEYPSAISSADNELGVGQLVVKLPNGTQMIVPLKASDGPGKTSKDWAGTGETLTNEVKVAVPDGSTFTYTPAVGPNGGPLTPAVEDAMPVELGL